MDLKPSKQWMIILQVFLKKNQTDSTFLPTTEFQKKDVPYVGIYKKPRPFNHIFGGDRILRAWYRGIKNAGPRKRAQGRAQDTPYHIISPYHNGIWRIFIECGKKPHARKSAQGRSARGPILPKSNRNFRQPPCIYMSGFIFGCLDPFEATRWNLNTIFRWLGNKEF